MDSIRLSTPRCLVPTRAFKSPAVIGGSVVVGVDDSREARDAAELGWAIAEAAGGSLHLVTAVLDPFAEVAVARLRLDADALHEALLDRGRKAAATSLHDVFGSDELGDLLSARVGRPEHVLAEFGRETDADSFVLGGRRHRAPASWIERGTAHHLLRVRERPILVTGPDGPGIDRVVAAVDVSSAARPTIRAASELAGLLGAGLEALHVAALPDVPPDWEPGLDEESIYAETRSQLEEEIWPLLPEGTPRRMLQGSPLASIRDAAADTPRTLLVVGAQGRGRIHHLLLGSTTEALLDVLPSSLAIIPTPVASQ